jgi:hypothetical protein
MASRAFGRGLSGVFETARKTSSCLGVSAVYADACWFGARQMP